MSLLQMSCSGAVMILVIAAVRALTIHKLPKKSFLALWGVAVARLLIPYSLPSAFSIYSLLERLVPAADVGAAIPTVPFVPVAPENHMIPQLVTPQSAAPAANTPAVLIDSWMVVWLVGAMVCATFFAVAYLKCRREFMASLPVDNEYAKRWLGEHRIYRTIEIRQSGRISAPLTYGVVHPVILMPKTADWNDLDTLNYVLTHEYVHIRRFDAVTKLVLTAAACVHWFNPAVWMMYVLANRDIELSCDEAVIRQFGERTKSAYAMTLICMEETRSGLTPLCNNFSKNAIEERIIAIMKMKKKSTAVIICAAMLVAGVSAVFATSPKPTEAKNMEDIPPAVMTDQTVKPAPAPGEQDVSKAIPERVHPITSSASDTSATPQTAPAVPEQDAEPAQQPVEPVVASGADTTEPDTPSISAAPAYSFDPDDPAEFWGIPEGPIAAGTELNAHNEEEFREMIRQLRMRGYDGHISQTIYLDGRRAISLEEDYDGVVRAVEAPEGLMPDWTYPVNNKGETYGNTKTEDILIYAPDLIGVYVKYDPDMVELDEKYSVDGYALYNELYYANYTGPMNTPEDVVAFGEYLKAQGTPRLVPVYDVNRDHIIGYFEVGRGKSANDHPGLSLEEARELAEKDLL